MAIAEAIVAAAAIIVKRENCILKSYGLAEVWSVGIEMR